MLMRIGSLVLGTMLLAVVPVFAGGTDLRVVRSTNDSEISVDVDSIRTIEGSHTEVRVMEVFGDEQKLEGMPPFTATVASLRIRCLTVQASLSNLVFLSSNKVINKFDYPVEWKRVDPKTDIGIVWKYVCTRGWDRDK
jgi:hypothetical protein